MSMICPQCQQTREPIDFPLRPRKYPWCHTCRYTHKLAYARSVNAKRTSKLKADPVLLEAERIRRRTYAKQYRQMAGDDYRTYQREYHRKYDPTYKRPA